MLGLPLQHQHQCNGAPFHLVWKQEDQHLNLNFLIAISNTTLINVIPFGLVCLTEKECGIASSWSENKKKGERTLVLKFPEGI